MKRKSILITFIVIAATTCALAFGKRSRFAIFPTVPESRAVGSPRGSSNGLAANAPATQRQRKNISLQPGGTEVPRSVVYAQLFHAVVLLKQKADEEELQGRSGVGYRLAYKSMLKLGDAEAIKLEEIAAVCDREVEAITEQAGEIISNYRAQRSKSPAESGKQPMAPYTELKELEEKRAATVMQAYDKLREALGAEAFERVDRAVQESIAANIKVMPLDPQNLKPQQSPDPQRFGRPTDEKSRPQPWLP
jgi:hypothetical protein